MSIVCIRPPRSTCPEISKPYLFRFYSPHPTCSTMLFLLKLKQYASTQVVRIIPSGLGKGYPKCAGDEDGSVCESWRPCTVIGGPSHCCTIWAVRGGVVGRDLVISGARGQADCGIYGSQSGRPCEVREVHGHYTRTFDEPTSAGVNKCSHHSLCLTSFHAIFETQRNLDSVTTNTVFFVKISSNDSLVARPYPQKNHWYPCQGRYLTQLTHEVSPH